MVTLTGAGGSGKTRLAVEVAGGGFTGESYLVDLVPVTEPRSLPSTVAMALGVRVDGMPLAIELAAARTRMLSVSEIAVRLVDRFGLPGRPTAVDRRGTARCLQ